jgi:hypothetical protein
MEKICVEALVYSQIVGAVPVEQRNKEINEAKRAVSDNRTPETEFRLLKAHTLFDLGREQVGILSQRLIADAKFVKTLKPIDQGDLSFWAATSEFLEEKQGTAAVVNGLKQALDHYSSVKPVDNDRLLAVHMAILRSAMWTEAAQAAKQTIEKDAAAKLTSAEAAKKAEEYCVTAGDKARLAFCGLIAGKQWAAAIHKKSESMEEDEKKLYMRNIEILQACHADEVKKLAATKRPKQMMQDFATLNIAMIGLAVVVYGLWMMLQGMAYMNGDL